MPSIKRENVDSSPATLRLSILIAAIFCLLFAFPDSFLSADEKRLAVYSPRANYSIKVTERERVEYVGLHELMQPLTQAEIKIGDDGAKLKANKVEGHFTNGSDKVKIGKEYLQLAAAAVFSSDQGKSEVLIPLESIPLVLSRYLKVQLDFHVSARRLFLDNTGTLFSAQIRKTDDTALVLTFPSRVEPQIIAEGGKLRIVFTRDPIVSGTERMNFDDKLISSLNFTEGNGTAQITVNGKSPLLASFAGQGKTIVISAAPQPPPAMQTPATTAGVSAPAVEVAPPGVQPDSKPKGIAQSPMAAALVAATPRYFVMIDASHGGTEPGARFSDRLLEKDITLALARRLRSELESRGVSAVLLRDGDTNLSLEQRATNSNTQRASLYVNLHAVASGNGVHVYTAFLPSQKTPINHSGFLLWETAHAPYIDRSKVLASGLVAELGNRKIESQAMIAPVPPLNNIATPAVVIEVSAAGYRPERASTGYQEAVVQAAAAAIIGTRAKIQETPLR